MGKKNKHLRNAAVYDRWLHSLGGGEQLAFAYAVALRDLGFKTDLVTHRKFDIELAKKKLNIDFTNIGIRYIPNMPDFQLSQYTEQYDIFVSNSYLDYIPNRSKYGILSVFFPSKINLSIYEYLKRAYIVPSLRKLFIYPTRFEGFPYDESLEGKIYKWLGECSTITFNKNIDSLQIELYFRNLAISCLDGIKFSLGNQTVEYSNRQVNVRNNTVKYTFKFKKPTKGDGLQIRMPDSEYSKTVALTRIIIPNYRYFFYNLFKKFFPKWEMRLHGGPSVTKYSDIESYDKILTISKFSQGWIKKYWDVESDVLFPPVAIENFYCSKKKENIIVNIGRFFVTGHCKKQLDMVRIFKKIFDSGIKNFELHFVGSVAEGEAHQQYFNMVKEEALGYPVFFHNNASFSELREILAKAKIYWHATGLDEDPERNPIRLEHFGITTVEAMASGCVPIVINLGGQAEIVTDECGYKWNTRSEFIEFTKELIGNNILWQKKSINAIERSKYFSLENFKNKLNDFLPSSRK